MGWFFRMLVAERSHGTLQSVWTPFMGCPVSNPLSDGMCHTVVTGDIFSGEVKWPFVKNRIFSGEVDQYLMFMEKAAIQVNIAYFRVPTEFSFWNSMICPWLPRIYQANSMIFPGFTKHFPRVLLGPQAWVMRGTQVRDRGAPLVRSQCICVGGISLPPGGASPGNFWNPRGSVVYSGAF